MKPRKEEYCEKQIVSYFIGCCFGSWVAYALLSKSNKIACPSGYKTKDEICISEEAIEVGQMVCEEGKLNGSGTECLVTDEKDVVYECEKDLILNNDKCLKTEEIAATSKTSCKEGKLVEDKCVTTKTVDPTETAECPSGSVRVGMTEYCGKNPRTPGTAYSACPEGTIYKYTYPGGVEYCYSGKRSFNPPHDTCGGSKETYNDTGTATCYTGGTLRPNKLSCLGFKEDHLFQEKCYELVDMKIEKTCPTDYKINMDNQCVLSITKDSVITNTCPKEYTLKDGKCLKTITSNAKKTCPDEYELSAEKCLLNKTTKPIKLENCEGDNLLLVDEKCYKTILPD